LTVIIISIGYSGCKDLINIIGFQEKSGKWYRRLSCNAFTEITSNYEKEGINFYGYYADYDWVVFCWLFCIGS
jgi:hypothetical protein